jgi:hypothetical protein
MEGFGIVIPAEAGTQGIPKGKRPAGRLLQRPASGG